MDLKKKSMESLIVLEIKKWYYITKSWHLKIRKICTYFKNVLPKPNEAMIANKAKHLISIFTTPLTPPSYDFKFWLSVKLNNTH